MFLQSVHWWKVTLYRISQVGFLVNFLAGFFPSLLTRRLCQNFAHIFPLLLHEVGVVVPDVRASSSIIFSDYIIVKPNLKDSTRKIIRKASITPWIHKMAPNVYQTRRNQSWSETKNDIKIWSEINARTNHILTRVKSIKWIQPIGNLNGNEWHNSVGNKWRQSASSYNTYH